VRAEALEELRAAIRVATSRGVAQARISLHPAELGALHVRLRATSGGLTAAVVAERPEAVAALQQAGAELKRALEDRGITVLRVDVAVAADAGGQTGAGEHREGREAQQAATAPTGTRSRGDAGPDPHPTDPDEHVPVAEREVRLDAGALVDVRA
jgi:flagellar hook-length control protein FliK